MKFIDDIFSLVYDIAIWFFNVASEAQGIWGVGPILSTMFNIIGGKFWGLLTPISHFGDWVTDTTTKIANIFSWKTIQSLIRSWLPGLESAMEWWSEWLTNVTWTIQVWMETYAPTIRGWITAATQGLAALLTAWNTFWTVTWPEWMSNFDSLATAWDTFWTTIFPTLFDVNFALEWWATKITEVFDLIESTLKEWFPQYDTEEEQRTDRVSFFTNPLDWLADRLEDWFWGKEEE